MINTKLNVNKIIGLMAENGLTQDDVAKLLGISSNSLRHKLKKRRDFKVGELEILADTFGVKFETFYKKTKKTEEK